MGLADNTAGPSRPKESTTDTLKLDAYRPIASSLQKTIAPYLSSHPQTDQGSLASLLKLDATSFSHRVSGKILLLNPHESTEPGTSELVIGKKRNRGDPVAKGKARAEIQERENEQAELGLEGMRKVKKRSKGGIKRGMQIDYTSLLPLHYLHTMYLSQLFSLGPMTPNTNSETTSGSNIQASSSKIPRLPDGLTADGVTSLLTKADFTGLKLAVRSSRNLSLEGIEGIVIEETASTFALVPPDSIVRIIPKDGTLFRFHFPAYAPASMEPVSSAKGEPSIRRSAKPGAQEPGLEDVKLDENAVDDIARHIETCPQIQIDLLGSSFLYRSADRAGRKFRPAQGKGGGSGWGEAWVRGEWSDLFEQMERGSAGQMLHGNKGQKRSARGETVLGAVERGVGARGRRKRGKSRRKDPPAGGTLEVHF